jgi:predicted aconitase with swiveling domain
MARLRAIVVGAVSSMLIAGAALAQNPVDAPTFDWSGAIPAGATLRIADVDGNISVAPSSSDQVQVHGRRTHVMSGGRALVFEVVKFGNDVTICARHPGGECTPEGEHGGGFRLIQVNRSPQANFVVELPAGVKLAAKTSDGRVDVKDAGADVIASSGDGDIHVNGASGTVDAHSGDGNITLDGVKGAVTAHTGDGHIRVTAATGPMGLKSGDGDIEVHLAALADGQTLTAHTGDGTVTLYLPSSFMGNVDASTGDGSIESDFPIATTGRLNSHHLQGTIGNGSEGAGRVNISTGDGDVHLKKG